MSLILFNRVSDNALNQLRNWNLVILHPNLMRNQLHSITQPMTNNEKGQKYIKECSLTFGDNALNTDHRTYEFREKLPWRDSARNKGTFKSHEHLFPFLQILRINSTSSVRHRIAERLNVLTWTPDNPAKNPISI